MMTFLVPLLTFVAVMSIGGAVLTSRHARRAPIEKRLFDSPAMSGAPTDRASGPRLLATLAAMGKWATSGEPSATLQEQMARAGYHDKSAASVYLGAKILLLIAGVVGLTALLLPTTIPLSLRVLLIVAGATAASFLPNLVVQLQRSRRREDVRVHLPDALDLLEICVSSGMGIDMAWNAVGEEIRRVSPVLADEMALADLEIHLGAPRAVALRHMAQRTGEPELDSLVAVLVQSERFGTSIAEALKSYAESMREYRSQRAQEAAEKMAVKLLIPMILFIFPAVMIVMAGPAVLSMIKMMGS